MDLHERPAEREWASIPISAIEHHAYCARQAALIHLDRYFADNLDTQRGQLAHNVVDTAGPSTTRAGIPCWNALPIAHEELGIHGICDVVELHDQGPVPVEHKSGSYRPGGPADLQLAAQVLCLRTMVDKPVPSGIIFAGRHRRRYEVTVDTDLENRLRRTITDLREHLRSAALPEPVADRRCHRCSLKQGCMPQTRVQPTDLFTPHDLGSWDD